VYATLDNNIEIWEMIKHSIYTEMTLNVQGDAQKLDQDSCLLSEHLNTAL